MDTQRHYSKAPITEAIIDLRVTLPEGTSVAALEECGVCEKEVYPTKKKLSLSTARMELGARLSTSASTELVGFSFTSLHGKQVFQVRVDGFTMSRLAPYERWESFRDEARRLWNTFRKMAKPVTVDKIAVRYVNRLDLPLPVLEMKDYFRTGPEVSPELPQALTGFFMQLNIAQPDIGCTLLLNQTTIDPPSPGFASIVLDIDLFRDADLPTDDEEVWHFFEKLHVRKNEVFEACITEKTRELIR